MFLEILRPDADCNSSPILFSWMCHHLSLSARCYPSGISFSVLWAQYLSKLFTSYYLLSYYFSVSSLHTIPRLCYTAWLNSPREMRMEYQSCFTFRKYIQVYQPCEFRLKISDSCLVFYVSYLRLLSQLVDLLVYVFCT